VVREIRIAHPLLSAVIVNYNGRRWLPRLLDSLLPQLPPDAEVLLVDNESADDSTSFIAARYPGVTIVPAGENRGYAGGVNVGLAHARGEWVLVLNTDLCFPPGAVAALLAAAQAQPRLGLAGPLLLDDSGAASASYGFEPTELAVLAGLKGVRGLEVRPHLQGPPVQTVAYLVGACLLARRAAVAEVGGMDERFFMYFEDVDWCRRFRQSGWEVAMLRAAQVVHASGGSSRATIPREVWFHISLLTYARKHYGLLRALVFRAAVIAVHLSVILRNTVTKLPTDFPAETDHNSAPPIHGAAVRYLILGRQPAKPGAARQNGHVARGRR
jgi:GT2 family glycosyltransferase